MIKRDMEILKQTISYNPDTGAFRRSGTSGTSSVGSRNKGMLVIVVRRNGFRTTHLAWRVAVYLGTGYYPRESDACNFKDGDRFNFALSNLEVLPMGHDELTALEFAKDRGLSYQMVLRMMKGAPSIRRIIDGNHKLYYKMADFKARCDTVYDAKSEGTRLFKRKRGVVHKHNKEALDFLRTFTLPPVRWEWSLR